jgi:tetratricopeptide (TPR) repeat protein
MNNKPKIFIGSSVEGLPIAYAVQQNLAHDGEITVWTQGVFELSQTSIESLISILENSDFGIFIFSPDDIIKIRKKEHLSVRDNVIFELGLFIGKLGRKRSFILMPDKPTFHVPTDLLGLTSGKYETSRSDGSDQAATGPVCHQIRVQIKKEGAIQRYLSGNEIQAESYTSLTNEEKDVEEKDWWGLYLEKKYPEAILLIENKIQELTSQEEIQKLESWKTYMQFKSDPVQGRMIVKDRLKTDPHEYNYISLSRILLWEKEFKLALEVINEGLARYAENKVLLFRKIEYYEMLGKIEDAISLILSDGSDGLADGDEDLSIRLAELYENTEDKRSEEAFSVILKSYKLNPSSETLAFRLSRLSQETNKEKVALYLLNSLTREFPDNSTYWGYLGNSCSHLNMSNKALLAYQKANELSNSKEAWILSNIGNVMKKNGLYSEARKYFNLSLDLDKNSEYSFNRISGIIKSEEEEEKLFSKLVQEGLSILVE